jgi:hypothetical protein
MGVGSICGRREKEAARILRLYERELPHIAPGTRPSDSEGRVSFGMDLRTLDHGPFNTLHSWDTHSWDWGMNHRGHHIPESAKRQPGEGKAAYTRRFAAAYMAKVERNLEAYHSLAA